MRSLRPPFNRYFVRVCTDTARQVDSSGPELPVRLPRVATAVAPVHRPLPGGAHLTGRPVPCGWSDEKLRRVWL